MECYSVGGWEWCESLSSQLEYSRAGHSELIIILCDMSYVGETGRTLQIRIKEHKRALTNGDPCMSALAEHAINHHHNIAWEDATVVDADPHMYRRRTLEAWHIRQEPKPMNRDRGLLPPVYDSLIRTNPPSHSFM